MLVLNLIGYWAPSSRSSPPRGFPVTFCIGNPGVAWPDVRTLVDPGWNPGDRARVATYLRAGHHLTGYLGSSYCRFGCGINRHVEGTGATELTDGEWAWPVGLAHYVERHAVRLPDEFVESLEARDWCVPGRGSGSVPAELAELIASFRERRVSRCDIAVDQTFWKSWSARVMADPAGTHGLLTGRFACLRMILRYPDDLHDDDRYYDAEDEIFERLRDADCGVFWPGGSGGDDRVEQFIEGIPFGRWGEAFDIAVEALSRHGYAGKVAILRVDPDDLDPHRDREPVECAGWRSPDPESGRHDPSGSVM